MSAADDVAEHIHGSLIDLRRRLDMETAIQVARAVVVGASQALRELSEDTGASGERFLPEGRALAPVDTRHH